MIQYTGCACSACHQPLREGQDVVVCPDCGAPYHRECYEKAGQCVYSDKHSSGFEWTPPHKPKQTAACPNCGTENPEGAAYCNHCGAPLRAGQRAASGSAAELLRSPGASAYAEFYRANSADPRIRFMLHPNETLDDIPAQEWAAYIGTASPRYLFNFKQMDMMHRKTSISLSAMLFGPFFFFYRKAWKPAFAFLAIELLCNIPALMNILRISDSPLGLLFNEGLISNLSVAASVLSFFAMIIRGIFGLYMYKQSAAAQIRQIRSEYTDPIKREYVLSAQGGTSFAAVIGAFFLLVALGALFSLLLGPNLEAVFNWIYS